jgi:phosphoribosylglycinamide formyltransferase-1
MKPRILVFASGSKDGGGSGFANLVKAMREKTLHALITGVVSHHMKGGVAEKAASLNIPFYYADPGEWRAEHYQQLVRQTGADFVALSGWLKHVKGLDPKTTINIHPGPLPDFGGKGMHGHHVHEAVIKAYQEGRLTYSQVCMHFVTEEYDRGPVFFRMNVRVKPDDTPETLATRVNKYEHYFQPIITNHIVNRMITWDGENPASLHFPDWYTPEEFEEM